MGLAMKSRPDALLVAAWLAVLPCCTGSPEGSELEQGQGSAGSGAGTSGSEQPPGSVTNPPRGNDSEDAEDPTTGAPEGSDSDPPEDVAASPSSACGSRAGLAAGLSEQTLESGGVSRHLLVYLPAGHGDDDALPVVFNLHGSGLTPEIQLETSGLVPVADAQGFVIVAPTGLEKTWNVPPDPSQPDDVQMIADALDAVESLVCVDRRRVFAAGFSGGARMSSQLACDLSSRIAAVAAVGGVRFPGPCTDARPFPILAFHGTGDDVNPYDGGGQQFWQTGVEAAIDGWAQHNGCESRRVENVADGIDRIGYAGCVEVALYRIEGFAHEWPRAITTQASADDLIWSFFERHPLRP
jgi:polyhydroxybutyrate depolymerase